MTYRSKMFFLYVLSVFLFTLSGRGNTFLGAAEPLTLADAGKTDYAIVLPENPAPVQATAAEELASNLKEISGAEFPIRPESEVSAGPAEKLLVIGPSALSRTLLAGSIDEDALGYDAIVIKQVGNSIVFSGHPQRGMLYAVNTFLEDALGCRWWTSSESFVPKQETVTVFDFDTVYTPKLIYREPYYNGLRHEEHFPFAVHLKCNGASNEIPEEYGGHQSILFSVHSFYQLISPSEYEVHPDWFPEKNGVRKVGIPSWGGHGAAAFKEMSKHLKPEQIHSNGTQLCLTNEELFQEMLKRVLVQIEKHPGTAIVSISQNDCAGTCRCAKCDAVTDEEGSPAGPYIRFVNRMAEEIEKVYPNIYVETLAYTFSRRPPKLTRARNNVIVRLCTIECSFNQSLREGEQNASFRKDMDGWAQMADHIFVWDYMANFHLQLLPYPNYRVWADNINYFADHHVIGIFEQGDSQCTTGDFVQLREWVVAKLLWNPNLDQRQLMKEFIEGYYAPELVPIYLDYFDLLSDRFDETGIPLGIYRSTDCDWIDLETLLQATELQNRAQKIAEELETAEPEKYAGLLFKVRRERIPIDLVWLMGYPQYLQEARLTGVADLPAIRDMEALGKDFAARLDASNVTKYRGGSKPRSFVEFKESFAKKYASSNPPKEASVPEICTGLPKEKWLDLQTIDFLLNGPDQYSFTEPDPKASDGETIRIPSNHHERALQYELDTLRNLNLIGSAAPHLYAQIRAEGAEGGALPEGVLFQSGIYNLKEKKDVTEIKSFTADDLNGSCYTAVDLGEWMPAENLLLWIAPAENNDQPFNIYVDRIVITF